MVAVDVKNAAGFPTSDPDAHSATVESRKYFSGAAMLPKRVGLRHRRDRRHAAHARLRTGHFADATRDRARELRHAAVAAVVDDQDFHCADCSMTVTAACGDRSNPSIIFA
jgi:hypothetical protein